jgi:hypothetical protein
VGKLGQSAGNFDAVEPRHGNIEHDDIRPVLLGKRDCLGALDRGSDQFDAGNSRKQQAEAVAGKYLVIGNDNAEWLSHWHHRSEG